MFLILQKVILEMGSVRGTVVLPLTSPIHLLPEWVRLLKSLGYLSLPSSKNIPCIEPPTVKVSI